MRIGNEDILYKFLQGQELQGIVAGCDDSRQDVVSEFEVGANSRGILGHADPHARDALKMYAHDLGLAFQVADDILDATATAADLGKSPGKDEQAGKLTYVTLFGLDSARRRLRNLEHELVTRALALEGPDGELGLLARYVCRRRS